KLKIRSVIDRLSLFIATLAKLDANTTNLEKISLALDSWLAAGAPAEALAGDGNDQVEDPILRRRIRFLRGFDVAFRLRRTRFVIRRLNELYQGAASGDGQLESGRIDALKSALYEAVEETAPVWN